MICSRYSIITFIRIITSIIFWGTVSANCIAQTKSSGIDTLMQTLSKRGQFNGSILIAEHGKVIYENGLGKADIKNNIDFTPATPCYLASLSKQFTAMAVMILTEQKKLSYSDLLYKYFPELPAYAQKITIRNLLNHTSGIPDYVELGLEHPGLTDKEVLDFLTHKDSLGFLPGDKFEYSNSNYVLLALIIEKVSSQTYSSFLEKYIFHPLQMNHTFVKDETHPEIPGKAVGYNRFGDIDDYDLLTYGEGGIYSTVEDFFKWDQALYTNKLVKQSTLREAFTPAKLNNGNLSDYGFGWVLVDFNGELTTMHAGRYGGFNTYIKRFPREENMIIFLTNHDFKNMNEIANPLTDILYGKPYALPKLSIAEIMFRIYKSKSRDSALQRYHYLKRTNDTTYDYRESELNELGYELMGMKKLKDAIEILKLNVEEYPASANVYDSLGEAYLKDGNKELSIKNYEKSLKLNPNNENAKEVLKKLKVG